MLQSHKINIVDRVHTLSRSLQHGMAANTSYAYMVPIMSDEPSHWVAQNRQHSFRSASFPSRHFMQTAFRNRARPSFFTCGNNTKKRMGVRQAIKTKKINTQVYERHKNIMLKSLGSTEPPHIKVLRVAAVESVGKTTPAA